VTDRETRSSAALQWFVVTAGVLAFYIELLTQGARPPVIVACLTMMGIPGAAWVDRIRRSRKGDEE